MKAVDLAYTAGIIDGEGCISIDKFTNRNLPSYCYRLKLRVGNTNYYLISLLKYNFGGNITALKLRNERAKKAWEWYLSGELASRCLELLLPYLRIKRPQAELAIRFQSNKKGRGHHLNNEQRLNEEADWLLAKEMNKRGGNVCEQ